MHQVITVIACMSASLQTHLGHFLVSSTAAFTQSASVIAGAVLGLSIMHASPPHQQHQHSPSTHTASAALITSAFLQTSFASIIMLPSIRQFTHIILGRQFGTHIPHIRQVPRHCPQQQAFITSLKHHHTHRLRHCMGAPTLAQAGTCCHTLGNTSPEPLKKPKEQPKKLIGTNFGPFLGTFWTTTGTTLDLRLGTRIKNFYQTFS